VLLRPQLQITTLSYEGGGSYRNAEVSVAAAYLLGGRSAVGVNYTRRFTSGSTPFAFDVVDTENEARLRAQASRGRYTAALLGRYDVDQGRFFDFEVALALRLRCIEPRLSYRRLGRQVGFTHHPARLRRLTGRHTLRRGASNVGPSGVSATSHPSAAISPRSASERAKSRPRRAAWRSSSFRNTSSGGVSVPRGAGAFLSKSSPRTGSNAFHSRGDPYSWSRATACGRFRSSLRRASTSSFACSKTSSPAQWFVGVGVGHSLVQLRERRLGRIQ
jgi:hypothetical protein